MRDPSVETRLLETARRLHEGYPDSPFATICNLQFPMLFVPLSPLPIGAGFRRKLSVVRSQFSATLPALAVTAARRRSFGLFIPYSLFPVPCSLFPIPYLVLPFLPICNLKSAMLSVRLSSPRTPPRRQSLPAGAPGRSGRFFAPPWTCRRSQRVMRGATARSPMARKSIGSGPSLSRPRRALRRLASLEVNKARAILQAGLWIIGDEHLQLFAGGHQPFLQIENSPAGPQTHHQFLGVERLG